MSLLRNYIPYRRRTHEVWFPYLGYVEVMLASLGFAFSRAQHASHRRQMFRLRRIRRRRAGQLELVY